MTFGDILREYRFRAMMSQQEAARLLNLSQSKYSRIETAVSEPSLELLYRISVLFKIDINEALKLIYKK